MDSLRGSGELQIADTRDVPVDRSTSRWSRRFRYWGDSLSPVPVILALLLAAAMMPGGCRRGNGLPSDLTRHLARQGIKITPVRVHAPLSSRGGYVVAPYSSAVAASIVATFKLQQIAPEDAQWSRTIEQAGGVTGVKEVWGIAGRPAQLRLKNGGQFEYFYLLVTADDLMYLVAMYAYG